MGMKTTIYRFLKRFICTVYKIFNDKCYKHVTIFLWHCLAILTFIRVRDQINIVLGYETYENIMFIFKIVKKWLKFLLLGIECGTILMFNKHSENMSIKTFVVECYQII